MSPGPYKPPLTPNLVPPGNLRLAGLSPLSGGFFDPGDLSTAMAGAKDADGTSALPAWEYGPLARMYGGNETFALPAGRKRRLHSR